MKNVLIVCTANKTRSIIAEEVANAIAAGCGVSYCFSSAGIAAMGNDIDVATKKILAEHNLNTQHTPTHIKDVVLDNFDEIHVMTERHKQTLMSLYSDRDMPKIVVLNIEDPYEKGSDAYEHCYTAIRGFYIEYFRKNIGNSGA